MRSAGLLPYSSESGLEVLLAHPGGPFFAKRDEGSWSVIKGMVLPDEADDAAALREFEEETGWVPPDVDWVPLGDAVMRSRKTVVAWAIRHRFDIDTFNPGTFILHGREYPEIDRVAWMTPDLARRKLNSAMTVFIDRLEAHLGLNVVGKETR